MPYKEYSADFEIRGRVSVSARNREEAAEKILELLEGAGAELDMRGNPSVNYDCLGVE